MERKIIQVSMAAYQGAGVVALCDDGSVWEFYLRQGDAWRRLPDIPQDEPSPTTTEKGE